MKKVLLLLCCFILTGCSPNATKGEDVYYKDPVPLRLSNGTYMPVESKSLSKTLSGIRILPINLNENGVVVLENEAEAYEMAVTLLQIKNPAFLKEAVEYGIVYDENLSVYKIHFSPMSTALGGGVTYIIKNTGEVLSVKYGE